MSITYENNFATYEFKNSLLYINYKEGQYIDYQAATTIVEDRLRFQSYKEYAILCDVSQVADISTEAREYLANYGSSMVTAVALISSTHTLHNMANYFVIINKPKIPTNIFDNLSEAEDFLKNHI